MTRAGMPSLASTPGCCQWKTQTCAAISRALCIHKVNPMQRALKDLRAWISGIRRDQTTVRAHANILELQNDGLLKINPLLHWTKADTKKYSDPYCLPAHPLFQRGYRSMVCSPCTVAIGANDDERAGRWAGRGKSECGLHTSMFTKKHEPGREKGI